MSNTRILERLGALADEVEIGQIRPRSFADQLLGHAEALEGIPYGRLKEVQVIQAQLLNAVEQGEEDLIDVNAVGDWLRRWVSVVEVGD